MVLMEVKMTWRMSLFVRGARGGEGGVAGGGGGGALKPVGKERDVTTCFQATSQPN